MSKLKTKNSFLFFNLILRLCLLFLLILYLSAYFEINFNPLLFAPDSIQFLSHFFRSHFHRPQGTMTIIFCPSYHYSTSFRSSPFVSNPASYLSTGQNFLSSLTSPHWSHSNWWTRSWTLSEEYFWPEFAVQIFHCSTRDKGACKFLSRRSSLERSRSKS